MTRWANLIVMVASAVIAAAQAPVDAPTVSFTLDFTGAKPSHYQITIASDGKGSYSSNGQLDQQSEPADSEPLQFMVSEKVRGQIFELSQRAHYFKGRIDSGRKNIANTGAKTLAYKDAHQGTQATYNYSPVAPVQELTSIFEGLSTTLEFGRRLAYFHKYEKLALEEDLKRMEEMQREKNLGDLQAVAAVLNEIVSDATVMKVTRARAMRLLAATGK